MDVPIRRGRDFTDGDIRGAPMVAIVNEALVTRVLRRQDPIGRRIQCGLDTLDFMTIVGVVGDVRTVGTAACPRRRRSSCPTSSIPGRRRR